MEEIWGTMSLKTHAVNDDMALSTRAGVVCVTCGWSEPMRAATRPVRVPMPYVVAAGMAFPAVAYRCVLNSSKAPG